MTNELMMAGFAVYHDRDESDEHKNIYLLVKHGVAIVLEIVNDDEIKQIDEHYISRARVEAELGIGTLASMVFSPELSKKILSYLDQSMK